MAQVRRNSEFSFGHETGNNISRQVKAVPVGPSCSINAQGERE